MGEGLGIEEGLRMVNWASFGHRGEFYIFPALKLGHDKDKLPMVGKSKRGCSI